MFSSFFTFQLLIESTRKRSSSRLEMTQQLNNLALAEPAESLENTQADEDGMDQGVDDEVESNAAELNTVAEHESDPNIESEPENELDAPTVIEKLE
jgi:hypothetical protein